MAARKGVSLGRFQRQDERNDPGSQAQPTCPLRRGLRRRCHAAIWRGRSRRPTLADTLAGDNRFARFLDLVTRASAVEEFRQAAPRTVFAPVDGAFLNAPQGLLQDLLGNSGSGNNQNDVERVRVMRADPEPHRPGQLLRDPARRADRAPAHAERRRHPARRHRRRHDGAQPGADDPAAAPSARPGRRPPRPARVVGGPIIASNGMIYPIDQIIWP